ncbi:alkaline phosphatase [Comamonas testosteroni]|uniref:Alkaline phosphatase n=1 Tax=Comamonas testosteroni TaxID=285 RepID=A0A373FM21_COMTE|nr:choice-of-anchor I family protein [Comamonas testosteroni]RGE45211.1 alkaline phosphatase [Comamonas testosteroni]
MTSAKTLSQHLLISIIAAAALAACGGGDSTPTPPIAETPAPAPAPEKTPATLTLEKIGSYQSGIFLQSAAEIPAFDPVTKRGFVVNAQKGALDVLDMSNPAAPRLIASLDATKLSLGAGASVNSVAVHGSVVAVAVQAKLKTDNGAVALFSTDTLSLLAEAPVGALPDMLTFTPDGKTLLVANEGEPSDDYQIDPEGSISIIDVSTPAKPVVRTADFKAFNSQKAALLAKGVRIFGPTADGKSTTEVAKDLEPEYIAVAPDGKTAWVTLQENNALAIVDIASARVTDVVALGYKDHSLAANALDFADSDGKNAVINITTAAGVYGMYQPDSIAAYKAADGATYLVTANEGDARAWGEGNKAYFGSAADKTTGAAAKAGDVTKGFVEEFRIKHLVHKDGFLRRAGDDLPAHLAQLGQGAYLNPAVFGWCGAVAGDPKTCRDDDQLGRLKVTWTMGYQTDSSGAPVKDSKGYLTYDRLYAYGGRSISIWDASGKQVWDSGSAIEKFIASPECKLGSKRDIACATYFNTGHDETARLDARSSAKGPEPEGLTVGQIGDKTFVFVGLERMGGVLVFDITNPKAPKQVDYLNTRENWTTAIDATTPPAGAALNALGDLGPEGLHFIAASKSPNGKPLLMVGNEVSGTTTIFQLNLTY